MKELHGLDDVVKLSWNENLFGPLPGVLDAIHGELENIWLYPEQPYIDFRNEVAAATGTSPTNILPAHGSLALLGLTASLLLRPGDRVVVPELTYGLYAQISSHARRVRASRADARVSRSTSRRWPRRAREVDASSPGSATRTTRPASRSIRPSGPDFLDALPGRCVAVVDEAYADFVPTRAPRPPRARHRRAGVASIVLRSFSKIFGLAGLRLGYAVVDEPLVPYFDLVEEPFNVNCVALAAGCACLRARAAVDERRMLVAAARAQLADELRSVGFEPLRSDTNFVLAKVDVDDVELGDRLAARGLLIRSGSDYGLAGYVRVTVGPSGLMERFGVELRDVCSSLRSPVA